VRVPRIIRNRSLFHRTPRRAFGRNQVATGIDGPMIERLVQGFYGRVRQDPLIGPRLRDTDYGLGAASRTDVRLLVFGGLA
jgi:hypothetical protein